MFRLISLCIHTYIYIYIYIYNLKYHDCNYRQFVLPFQGIMKKSFYLQKKPVKTQETKRERKWLYCSFGFIFKN